ncbi:MAG: Abi family protein [Verrucomicrobia bacterium]|nr:Abi family protein [Verrucomicrobiota bacterium]
MFFPHVIHRILRFFGYEKAPTAGTFSKTAQTYTQQVAVFQNRGLIVLNPAFAEHCLAHCNYYRLSAYQYPFLATTTLKTFRPGVHFEEMWELYQFDRELRRLINESAKRVEISVRSRWAYELGHIYGPLAYATPAHFRKPKEYKRTLQTIEKEIARSREEFIAHFKTNYGMSHPPIWAVCEVMSFGNVSKMYSLLAKDADRKRIASAYGLSQEVFGSLLHHLTYIRNLCAHHSRVWNRRMVFTIELPKKGPPDLVASLNTSARHKIYNTLVLLAYMRSIIEPTSTWPGDVRALVTAQPAHVPVGMGFPANWATLPIWKP